MTSVVGDDATQYTANNKGQLQLAHWGMFNLLYEQKANWKVAEEYSYEVVELKNNDFDDNIRDLIQNHMKELPRSSRKDRQTTEAMH